MSNPRIDPVDQILETGLKDLWYAVCPSHFVKERPVSVVPLDQSVIDSEQKIADAFDANDLLPNPVSMSDYVSDEFNDQVTAAADKAGGKTASGVS